MISGIFPPDSGGPAKFAAEFSEWASQHGLEVKVISYVDTRPPIVDQNLVRIARNKNIITRYFKMICAIIKSTQRGLRIFAVGAFLETYIASILKGFNYVVKVPGDIVWERARNNKVTDLNIIDFQGALLPFKYRIFRNMFSRSLKRASLVIVPSKSLFQLCIRWGIPYSKLRLVRNSVDLSKFSKLARDSFQFDVLTVCRLTSWKGVDELIDVCARLNLKLAIAGDGPERARLEEINFRLGSEVNFFGNVSEDQIVELLSKSKIFVLNSHYEGLPHALVEARAAGLISIAREGTGSAEVIRDGKDGFLVGSSRNLADAITLAINNMDISRDMSELAAIHTRARFNRDKNFQKIAEVLQELDP